jgi:aldose 1-epimerase
MKFRQPLLTGPLITLNHGPYALIVAPGFGGRIVSFRYAARDILRPTPELILDGPKVYEFAGFPLMPYSGPLFGPGFTFAGSTHSLDRTVREEPTATHGDAWISPFRVIHQNASELTLEYDHEPGPGIFPFRWRGHLRYALDEAGLSILLRVTSRDHRRMPAGIGFHPYFTKYKGSKLRFDAVGVWPADAPEAVADGCQHLGEDLSFREGRDVSEVVVDRLYEGWDGRAELIASDGFRTLIEADGALDKLQLYSAWDYPYVCIEPVSNANDGFNRMAAGVPSHGVRVLEPNRSIEGLIRIYVDTDTVSLGGGRKEFE